MDRSVGRLPDPVAGAPNRERRRCVRQKLHTPVYASFNGPQTGMTVDLSELLDLHEEGFAVQTSERLEANRAVTICLDLPETRNFIHGSGQVIWSDESGRGGIHFSQLAEGSRKVLQEWLFANLLIACSNHQARTDQLARHAEQTLPAPATPSESGSLIPICDRTERVSTLEAVRREVRELGDNVDEVFHVITERMLSLTGATGAALAFLTDDNMVCRARAGDPAPPLGAPVDVKQGLSGECVRSGLLVSCDDLENDPRVDPEVGRALGIGSLMACPIVSDFRVVGLLEIFSPHPHSFTRAHGTILERLVEMVPKVHGSRALLEGSPARISSLTAAGNTAAAQSTLGSKPVLEPAVSVGDSAEPTASAAVGTELDSLHAVREALWNTESAIPEKEARPSPEPVSKQDPEPLPESVPEPAPGPSRLLYRALLGLVIGVVALAVGYVIGPAVERRWPSASPTSRLSSVSAAEASSLGSSQGTRDRGSSEQPAHMRSVAELQSLAEKGDAEAQWQMAVRYHNGEGVPQDDTQAMKWFERAAEQGHVDAQSRLGAYYWAGRGVPEDLSKAYYWSAIATAQGDEISKSRLEGLTYQMTHAQISSARQQAEVWLHNHNQRPRSEAN